jgi:hypothetical protein
LSRPPLAREAVAMLAAYRSQLEAAGIASAVPIRVCESGWPAGPGRDEDDQAAALAAILTAVDGVRAALNVTHWELFTLRDADSSRDDPFCRFGILRDDYSPKPAYAALRALIRPRP